MSLQTSAGSLGGYVKVKNKYTQNGLSPGVLCGFTHLNNSSRPFVVDFSQTRVLIDQAGA